MVRKSGLKDIWVIDELPDHILLRFRSEGGDVLEIEITERQRDELVEALLLCV